MKTQTGRRVWRPALASFRVALCLVHEESNASAIEEASVLKTSSVTESQATIWSVPF